MFLGEVVPSPRGAWAGGAIYLMGHDGYVRRVIVKRAVIVYDARVPAVDRVKPARKALVPGAELRVIASVDSKNGEWTASRVEVIKRHAADFEVDGDEESKGEISTVSGSWRI